ncbi:MAG TPA: NAD-dependent epimerase/dehydratase family protein [Gemmatimonadota bacterium]
MRVLVIGGTGFIGPPVVRLLAGAGHEVAVFHRGEHEPPLPAGVRHVHSPSAAMPVLSFPADLAADRPDVVLHMTPLGARDARAAVDAFAGRAGRVVALSSCDVYAAYGRLIRLEDGPPDHAPLAEDAPLRSRLFPYRAAASGPDDWTHDYEKILAERVFLEAPDLPATVLRLPAVYGPGDPQRRLHPWLRRMVDARPAILLAEEAARWRWSHGYVQNVAEAIARAVTGGASADRVYNVADDPAPELAAWVGRIGEAAGWRGRIATVPRAELPAHLQDPYDYRHPLVVDSSRIRRELGWSGGTSLADALRATVEADLAAGLAPADPARFDYAAEDDALRRIGAV